MTTMNELDKLKQQLIEIRAGFADLHKVELDDVDNTLDYRATSIAISRLDECYLWLQAAMENTFCVKP